MTKNTIIPGHNQTNDNSAVPQILVVDDSAFSRVLIVKELKAAGFDDSHIHQSNSGAEALGMIQDRQYELFILDIIMSGVDGIAVLQEVKKVQPKAKVIMCSSSNSTELIKDLVVLGIDAFIVKPFKSEDFQKILMRHMGIANKDIKSSESGVTAKCHHCDSEMTEINLVNTLSFFCPRACMQIGPLVKALVSQQSLDEDYAKTKLKG